MLLVCGAPGSTHACARRTSRHFLGSIHSYTSSCLVGRHNCVLTVTAARRGRICIVRSKTDRHVYVILTSGDVPFADRPLTFMHAVYRRCLAFTSRIDVASIVKRIHRLRTIRVSRFLQCMCVASVTCMCVLLPLVPFKVTFAKRLDDRLYFDG